jgi:hypothetical protein
VWQPYFSPSLLIASRSAVVKTVLELRAGIDRRSSQAQNLGKLIGTDRRESPADPQIEPGTKLLRLAMMTKRMWPYPVPSPDKQSAEDKRDFAFFESALREGFQPWDIERTVMGAFAKNGREGEVVRRGGRGRYWEFNLSQNSKVVASRYTDGFEPATTAALSWLRGEDLTAVTERIKDAIVEQPGERGW